MAVNLSRIQAGDLGQDLISSFNNNATSIENEFSSLDDLVATKVGSANVLALREQNNTLEYSLDGETWKKADITTWGNITGTLTDQTDLRDALNAKANKSVTDNLQSQVNTLGNRVNTATDNISALDTSVTNLGGRVSTLETSISDVVKSGNITYIRQVIVNNQPQFEWSLDNINWNRLTVVTQASWGNITGTLTDQIDLNNKFISVDNDISAVAGNVSTLSSDLGSLTTRVSTVEGVASTNTDNIAALQSSKANSSALTAHTSNTNNPHSVTKAQVGLGNVDNTADINKPLSNPQRDAVESIVADYADTLVKDENRIDGIWLGTYAEYNLSKDLSKGILYFINDQVEYNRKYLYGNLVYNEDTGIYSLEQNDIKVSFAPAAEVTAGYDSYTVTIEYLGSATLSGKIESAYVMVTGAVQPQNITGLPATFSASPGSPLTYPVNNFVATGTTFDNVFFSINGI